MKVNLYYKLANGNWVSRYDIEMAFYISTGAKYTTGGKEFIRWLFPLLGESILAVKKADDSEFIAELLKSRQKIMAMKVYKDLHDCTLKEAREAIERMIENEDLG